MTDNLPARPGRELAEAQAATAQFIAASKAANTLRAYDSDWRDFVAWCDGHSLASLPAEPETLATYLSALARFGRSPATIRRRVAAIGHRHARAGHQNPGDHPGVTATLQGIARAIGTAPHKKQAMTAEILQKAIRKIPTDLAGLRDRALLLIGFAAALRRSELVDLKVNDIGRHTKGIVLTVRRSKTDQTGAGVTKAVPHGRRLGVVAALDAWLAAAKITEGPVFRGVRGSTVLPDQLSDRQVSRAVKSRAKAVGLDPDDFAGHSLRSGFISTAADHGADLAAVAKHAGHAKIDTTLGYVQIADAFRNHSGSKFL
jgi:site-specific recombinase XerD